MSFTFDDPPGETLPTRLESIDGTATNAISEVRVAYDEELVYTDAGGFVAPYLSSTLSSDKKTLSVKRAGGWQRAFDVHVEDPKTAPSNGQQLALIYEIDFRTLPSQAIGAAGSYTIDGLTWWAKGLTSGLPFGASMSSAVVNGSGLRLSIIGSNAVMSASGDMNMRNLVLPLANIPNASLNAPTFIRGKFSYAFDNSAYAFIGLVNTTSDAAGYLSAQRSAETFVGPPNVSASPVTSLKAKYGTGAITDVSARGGSAVYSSHFAGVQYANGFTDVGDQAWDGTGSIPSLSAFKPQNQGLSQYEVGALANPCIMFAVSSHVQDYYLTHLSVYQPKVAA